MKKNIKISDIKQGDIKHAILPDDITKRITNFKNILADVDKSSLEETIDGFKRDVHPEKEIKIWEHIASAYQSYVLEKSITDLAVKKDVFSVALQASMGIETKDLQNIKHLTKDQIENIIYNYNPLTLNQIL